MSSDGGRSPGPRRPGSCYSSSQKSKQLGILFVCFYSSNTHFQEPTVSWRLSQGRRTQPWRPRRHLAFTLASGWGADGILCFSKFTKSQRFLLISEPPAPGEILPLSCSSSPCHLGSLCLIFGLGFRHSHSAELLFISVHSATSSPVVSF